VETQAQLDYLTSHHCQLIQGYLYAHPMSIADTSLYLLQQTNLALS